MLYSVLPTYYAELGLLPYQVGLVLSLNRGIRLLTNHLAERLCRRYSLSLLFGLNLAGGACLTAIYALVPTFFILLLARMGWGLCWSFIRQISLMTVVDSATEGNVGRLMGFYSGISRMGSIAGNFVGALGHDLFGYTTILIAFAVVSALAIPLGPLSRRNLRHFERAEQETGAARKAGWELLFAGFVVGCVGSGLVMSTMGLMLKESIGESLSLGGMTIGVATLTGGLMASRWIADLAAPMMGGLTDRIGRRGGATLFLICGALVLLIAVQDSSLMSQVLAILLFFLFATGATIALTAEAGVRGGQSGCLLCHCCGLWFFCRAAYRLVDAAVCAAYLVDICLWCRAVWCCGFSGIHPFRKRNAHRMCKDFAAGSDNERSKRWMILWIESTYSN